MVESDDPLTYAIIGAAIAVSKFWGNGLLESVYKKSLVVELTKRKFEVVTEKAIPAEYEGFEFDVTFRADIIVNAAVILEVKAVAATLPVHRDQVLTYMRLSGITKGLLINFHARPFTDGITRLLL